ncbi:hypothetical protein EVAR_66395_1 [Eumeta japonica]|uniref:Uncharacterized protein n=1 Tax=Eumeta variegata TaxID=151549 RepID=A0A4C1ZT52_EUMVA|nr:hypothetical protein EVAR_66395_1 [Eumeta japonica]
MLLLFDDSLRASATLRYVCSTNPEILISLEGNPVCLEDVNEKKILIMKEILISLEDETHPHTSEETAVRCQPPGREYDIRYRPQWAVKGRNGNEQSYRAAVILTHPTKRNSRS